MNERQKNLEPLEVMIETARSEDVRAMAQLRYENVVHRASKRDIQLRPHERGERDYVHVDVEKILDEMLKPDNFFLSAKNKDGKVVGMCGMIWTPEISRFQFVYFFVDPALHRRGVGEKLYEAAKSKVVTSSRDPKGLFLYTKVDNVFAQKLYEKWGFRKTDKSEWRSNWNNDRTRDNLMKMILNF